MRGFLVRPPNPQAVFLEQIHDAQRERIVRADDGEFDFLFLREREQFRQIFGANVDAFDRRRFFASRSCAMPALPGAHQICVGVRRLRQFPNQRVFASARTDDQNFHDEQIESGNQANQEKCFLRSRRSEFNVVTIDDFRRLNFGNAFLSAEIRPAFWLEDKSARLCAAAKSPATNRRSKSPAHSGSCPGQMSARHKNCRQSICH